MSLRERGWTLRGWSVHTSLRRLSILGLVGLLLAALSMPRFGLVWHEHEHPDADHPQHQLLRLLTASQGPHPPDHAHHHAADSQVCLSSVETSHVHGHYVNDSLLVLYGLHPPLTLLLLRVFLRPYQRRVWLARHRARLVARAPPTSPRLVSSCFSTGVRSLCRVV